MIFYKYLFCIVAILLLVNALDLLRESIEQRVSDTYVGITLEYEMARILKKAGEEDGNR